MFVLMCFSFLSVQAHSDTIISTKNDNLVEELQQRLNSEKQKRSSNREDIKRKKLIIDAYKRIENKSLEELQQMYNENIYNSQTRGWGAGLDDAVA